MLGRLSKRAIVKKAVLKLLVIFLTLELVLRSVVFFVFLYYSSFQKPDRQFNDDAFRIICVGESTTLGWPVHGDGYPEQLQQALNNSFPYRKFKVFNLGVGGITSTEVARHFHKNIIDYKPHLAIILVGNNSNGPKIFVFPKSEGIISNIMFYAFDKLNRVKIFKLAKFSFDFFVAVKNKKVKVQRAYSDIFLKYDPGSYLMTSLDHQHNLEMMLKIAHGKKIKVLISNYFDSTSNDFLREFANKNNIPFCDNEKKFKEWLRIKGDVSELISLDGWHPSALGYFVMAQNLYEEIIKYNLVD